MDSLNDHINTALSRATQNVSGPTLETPYIVEGSQILLPILERTSKKLKKKMQVYQQNNYAAIPLAKQG